MRVYLNNWKSVKNKPNENQGRELLLEQHRALALVRAELGALWRRNTPSAPVIAFNAA